MSDTTFSNILDISIVAKSFTVRKSVTRKKIPVAENFILREKKNTGSRKFYLERKTLSAEKTKQTDKLDFMRLNQVHLARR